ncbi:MAG TPA: HAD family phosphatase [Chryseosolibacter sp.]
MSNKIETIVFDLGNVLIEWNPRHLYRKILKDEDQITWFLENICTSEWNDQQDAGRTFEEGIRELVQKHPEWEEAITAWGTRWQETINGSIPGTVEILRTLRDSKKYRLYALTNWSAETFPWALDNFEFLHWFEGIVVSGHEKTRKPYPDFFNILFTRYKINPSTAVFIDDNIKNIKGADEVGLKTILFESPEKLRAQLTQFGVQL